MPCSPGRLSPSRLLVSDRCDGVLGLWTSELLCFVGSKGIEKAKTKHNLRSRADWRARSNVSSIRRRDRWIPKVRTEARGLRQGRGRICKTGSCSTALALRSWLKNHLWFLAAMNLALAGVKSVTQLSDFLARDQLERVLECLNKERYETFEDCVMWAVLKFEDHFSNCVKQLTYIFPEDAATSTGAPFQSAAKRFPQPLEFSTDDPAHFQFTLAAAILRAQAFGITVPDWAMPPDFDPRKVVKLVTDEKATSKPTVSTDAAAVINELVTKLEVSAKKLPSGYRMNPIQFEKVKIKQAVFKKCALATPQLFEDYARFFCEDFDDHIRFGYWEDGRREFASGELAPPWKEVDRHPHG